MTFTNWADFASVAVSKGCPPAIIQHLQRTIQVYEIEGCSSKVLKWTFNRYVPWATVITAADSTQEGRTQPIILYPSKLIEDAFFCEKKPEIIWCYGDRGEGKSYASYGLGERWIAKARKWKMTESFGPPRIYVWGDVAGKVPSERGWFRCPDWFVPERRSPGFPLLELYDEVPFHLRSGGMSREIKSWAERLTRSRHVHVWTIMNMVQAKMAAKRGREMDGITLDRHSGIRQLQERIEALSSPQLRTLYRQQIPLIKRNDPCLVLTQLSREQGRPGTWITNYESSGPSWSKERDHCIRDGSALASAAPWPPEAVLAAATAAATTQLKAASKRNQEIKDTWAKQLGYPLDDPRSQNRAVRVILRAAGIQFDAIAEILGGNEPSYRAWSRRNRDQPGELLAAGSTLALEIPARNRKPVLFI